MLGIFRKKEQEFVLYDLEGNALEVGDIVLSLRYDMGECKLLKTGNGFEYQPINGGHSVSWLKMIDATTERQKVKKVLAG